MLVFRVISLANRPKTEYTANFGKDLDNSVMQSNKHNESASIFRTNVPANCFAKKLQSSRRLEINV